MKNNFWFGITLGIILQTFILMPIVEWSEHYNTHNAGYKKGQVDAINGKIHYELKKNPDSTSEWVHVGSK